MTLLPFLPGLVLAITIGLLIGFERGWRLRDEPDGGRVAGLRTFVLLSLLGGIAGLVALAPINVLALLCVAGAIGAVLIGHGFEMRRDGNVSATSAVAAMLTLLLGAFATTGHAAMASIGAGVTVAILAGRGVLHEIVRASSEDDLKAFLRLALLVFVILPLLPDVGMGPFDSINPRRLWFVVVIVGGISFGGYVLTRWLGGRLGGIATAILGAVVSSTAVTIACAQQIRAGGGIINQAAIALASAIMLVRTTVLVALLAPMVLVPYSWLVGPALLFSAAAAALTSWASRSSEDVAADTILKPPGLQLAFLFGLLVAAVTLAAAIVEHLLGGGRGAAVVALGGMVDVDSAIAAIGTLPPGALSPRFASLAIATPVMFNTLLKLGLMLGIAGWRRTGWAAANLAATAAILFAAIVAAIS